jgi:hypothetical protein
MAELSPEELSRTKLELVEHALRRIRVREDTHDAGSLYFPAGYDSDLHLALAESTKLEARRVVVCGSTTDTDETFADSVWREVSESMPAFSAPASSTGCTATRVRASNPALS